MIDLNKMANIEYCSGIDVEGALKNCAEKNRLRAEKKGDKL
jgi:hypothetical protein